MGRDFLNCRALENSSKINFPFVCIRFTTKEHFHEAANVRKMPVKSSIGIFYHLPQMFPSSRTLLFVKYIIFVFLYGLG